MLKNFLLNGSFFCCVPSLALPISPCAREWKCYFELSRLEVRCREGSVCAPRGMWAGLRVNLEPSEKEKTEQ